MLHENASLLPLRVALKAKITHMKEHEFQPSNLGQLRYPINGFAYPGPRVCKRDARQARSVWNNDKTGGPWIPMPSAVKIMPRILAPQCPLDTEAWLLKKLPFTGGHSGILRKLIVWYVIKIYGVLCRLFFKIKA
jgi:hypothetical protein